jgi:hypothetical protein
MLLEAAKYDPLRAQELEERLGVLWYERWCADRDARIKAQEAKDKDNG